MSLSIKTKQVAGVTFLVGLAVIPLSTWYISSLVGIWLEETSAQAELLTKAVTERAFDAVRSGGDPVEVLRTDGGIASILKAGTTYSENVIYATIVDVKGQTIASDPISAGQSHESVNDFGNLLAQGRIAQARAIYGSGGQPFEYRTKLLLAPADSGEAREFGSIRIGVSTVLLQRNLESQMKTPVFTAAGAIVIALLVAMLLAQVTLRPIHVIRSGLARLGRGELDVNVDLPADVELSELGDSFKAVSARLAADRDAIEDQRATLESVVENLEDAVALFGPDGTLLFANPAMRPAFGGRSGPIGQLLPATHPYREAIEAALATRESLDPATVQVPGGGERLLMAHPVEDADGNLLGVMLVARNLTYLTQVESTLSYSRKLAALSRLSAGIAHEVKNPLNATMIHLELLKMQLAEAPGALEHVAVIAAQVRRLDEVVQGFLKFTRPEDLQLQPVPIQPLIEGLLPIISAEASSHHVEVKLEFQPDLPPASADSGLLQQAFLNLAINACQAMPHGGRLRIAASRNARHQIEVVFEDTGIGIPPENLARIFDLYFTTKEHGSGIGLSLVFRTVQLHDGEIDVESVPGRGTTFRVKLREAPVIVRQAPRATLFVGARDGESSSSGRGAAAS